MSVNLPLNFLLTSPKFPVTSLHDQLGIFVRQANSLNGFGCDSAARSRRDAEFRRPDTVTDEGKRALRSRTNQATRGLAVDGRPVFSYRRVRTGKKTPLCIKLLTYVEFTSTIYTRISTYNSPDQNE